MRTCKFCDPRNRDWSNRIKELYLQRKSLTSIMEILRGEGISCSFLALKKHLKHLGLVFPGAIEEAKIDVMTEKEIDVIKEIEESYQLLRNMAKQATSMPWDDPSALQAIRGIMSESRECLTALYKLRKELAGERTFSREGVTKMIIKLLKDIPDESLQKVVNKLEAEKGEVRP